MSNTKAKIDQRMLTDLYDVSVYYDEQLIKLDLRSYNGLSNEHKKVHKHALRETAILRQLIRIYTEHPHLVDRKIEVNKEKGLKIVHFVFTGSDALLEYERELVSHYAVSMILEEDVDAGKTMMKLKLTYNSAEEDESSMEKMPLEMEILYMADAFRAHIAPFIHVKHEEVDKDYPLLAPMVTNYLKSGEQRYRGDQDPHLFVPDLHTRILDLFAKLDSMARG